MMGAFSIFGSLLNGAAWRSSTARRSGRAFGEFVAPRGSRNWGRAVDGRAWRAAKWLEEAGGRGGEGRDSSFPSFVVVVKKPDFENFIIDPDWGSLRVMASTGEASAPEDYSWLASRARVRARARVLRRHRGRERLRQRHAFAKLVPSTFTTPTLGCSFVLLVLRLPPPLGSSGGGSSSPSSFFFCFAFLLPSDDDLHMARQSPHGSTEPCSGELALVPPILGSSQALFVLDDEEEGRRRHRKTYYEGMPRLFKSDSATVLRRHGDAFERLPCGGGGSCYAALGRTDDAMNLGGVKVASAEVERVVVAALGPRKLSFFLFFIFFLCLCFL